MNDSVVVNKGAITAHFIAHWGVPSEIRPRPVDYLGMLAVLEFPPRGPRTTWRYATNGMSSLVQPSPSPKIPVRTELYACLEHEAPWVEELLAAMASYPWEHHSYFSEWDTIEVSRPIDGRSSPYTALMLGPPGPFDPVTLGLAGGVSENILVHQVIGLVPSELEYVRHHNARILWERIVKAGEPVLDNPRLRLV